MAIGTHALDVGALSPFFWIFEEREKVKLTTAPTVEEAKGYHFVHYRHMRYIEDVAIVWNCFKEDC